VEIIDRNPSDGVYAATDDYVHALEVRGAERLLFVAGTMGLDPSGTPGTTLAEQLPPPPSSPRLSPPTGSSR
jgi:2-iminobutanoate/2-iminopropanoate deaminase